ncbi:MAG: [acyl-carrier-protein] S-malonyltransferase [Burkholderiaceae bacterium]|nr:MAG: [acyl-carrier-protein] S-malonyltransferase [Burkholderiaceae bacterium]
MSKIAFIFPGQGSQAVGMLNDFAGLSAVDEVLQQASASLGEDVGQLIANGPAEQLNLTTNTQPVMLVAGYACYRAWLAAGGRAPDLLAGHSLGEYTALTAAGTIAFEAAPKLVRFRAQAMQEAVPVGTGGMAAILGLDDDAVRAACSEAAQGEVVQAVNFNAPAQVVIAGHKAAVDRACAVAQAKGAKRALPLPVSAPFHSSLMLPAAEKLEEYLAKLSFSAPAIPVINNVDVAIEHDADRIKEALVRQAWRPVRWVEIIQALAAQGVTRIVECGPGKVLAGLVKRIDKSIEVYTITDQASLNSTLEALK